MTPVIHPTEPAPVQPAPREPHAPEKLSIQGWLFGILTIVAVATPLVLMFQQWREPKTAPIAVKRAPVQRGTLLVRTRVSGSTAAKESTGIIAPLLRGPESDNPMVLMKLSPAGSLVKQGEVVAQFDPQQITDHLDDTKDGLQNHENAVAKRKAELLLDQELLRQRLRTAKGQVDKARLDLKTIEVRSAIQAEIFRLAVEEAVALYAALQHEVEQQTESQRAALRIAEVDRDLEILHVKRHSVDLSRLTIKTPTSGLVVIEQQRRGGGDQLPYAVGDRLNPGTLFARIVNPDSMLVEATINQAELEQFAVGQEAEVRLDAFPGAVFKARLRSIGALATTGGRREQFYVRTVPLTFQILESDARILPGLSASADVLIDRVEDALLVPADAVEVENGKSFVQVETQQGVQKRPVTTGATDGTRVAILNGVSEGDVLLVQ